MSLNLIECSQKDLVCSECGSTEIKYLLNTADELPRCKDCFSNLGPFQEEIIVSIEELLEIAQEIKDKNMTVDDMHRLYGKDGEAN